METPKSTIRIKYYLVGRRFYQIAVTTPTAGVVAADIRRHADDLEKKGEKDLAKNFRENFSSNSAAEMVRSMVLIADEFFASFKLTGKPVMGGKTRHETKVIAVGEKRKAVPVKKVIRGIALKKVDRSLSGISKSSRHFRQGRGASDYF